MRAIQFFLVALVSSVIGAAVVVLLFRMHTSLDNVARFATVLSAMFAAVAATSVAVNARYNAKSVRATLFRELSNDYGSEEMGKAVRRLHEWDELCRQQNLDPADEYIRRHLAKDPTVDDIHWLRRRVSHYYTNVWVLAERGLIDQDLLGVTIDRDQADFFVRVVRPMDVKLQRHFGRNGNPRVDQFFKNYLARHPD